jgi:flagellar basal body rod protein FlgG
MNVGMYKGAAALTAFETWQDTIAQNLASVAVPGYRRNEAAFTGVLADVTKVKKGDQVSQTSPGVMPSAHRSINMMPGINEYNGVDTNFAVEGEGFFRIRRADGTFGYTRDGNFRLNSEYNLVTQSGNLVEGENGPITFRQEGGVISINDDALLLQGKEQVGKLAVFSFANPEKLHRIGEGLLQPYADNPATVVQRPSIVSRSLEASNVRPLEEMIHMVTIGRAYDAAKKVIDISDDSAGKAIQYLGGQG